MERLLVLYTVFLFSLIQNNFYYFKNSYGNYYHTCP